MAEKKKREDGHGGVKLTDEQKIALIKTGNPNGDVNEYRSAKREELKKRANLPDEIMKRKAKKK